MEAPLVPSQRTARLCAVILDRRDTVPAPPFSTAVNRRLLHHLPAIYRCPSAAMKTISDYPGAHVGHNPLLLGGRVTGITDGLSKTLLVGEVQPSFGAPWVLGPTASLSQFGSDHSIGSHVALADGSVRLFLAGESAESLERLFTPAGND